MHLCLMKAKLHNATVTEADLYYEGSITLDSDLMDAVGLLDNEKVQVVNINNGARIETYVIRGEAGSGVVCLNGPAARLFHPGDKVHIIAYAWVDQKELPEFKSRIAILGEKNQIVAQRTESVRTPASAL